MKEKKNLIIIITIIAVLLAGSLAAIFIISGQADDATYAYIYQSDTLIKTIDLTDVNETYTFTVTGDNGCYNIIEVRNGSIGIVEASCPDGLCCNMGFISTPVIPITCLPNHLVIELSDDNAEHDIDIIVK